MRRPLVIVGLLYAAGLVVAEYVQLPLLHLLIFTLGFTALALAWPRARPWLLLPLIIAFAWTNLISRTAIVSPNDLRTLLTNSATDAAIRGRLLETPRVKMFVRGDDETFHTLAKVEVSELRQKDQWVPAYGCIMTTTPEDLDGLMFRGMHIEVRGIIAPPQGPLAPGLFDYRAYLKRQGIHFQLKADGGLGSWTLLEPTRPTLSDRFLKWCQHTLERGLGEKDEPLRLLGAMTLGNQTGINNEVYAPFMKSGTMHIFAISGLHIALIAGLLVALLRVFRIPRKWCPLVVIPLIWFYTGATGWQSSAIRSAIMMSVIIGGWWFERPSDLLNSLFAAGLIILAWDPQQLFQASFQLSFFVVLSIALLAPPLQTVVDRLLAHDPLLPVEVLPRWKRWRDFVLRNLMLSFVTSLAACLGSLPLTAYYFHLFSPVTLLANLFIVPVSGFALACNLGALLCGDWLPWIGELFNHSAWLWMWLMVWLSNFAAKLPGAFIYVPAPTFLGIFVYYAILAGIFTGWLFKRENRLWSVAATAVVLAYGGYEWQRSRTQTDITVLNVSGAHAVHIDGPGRQTDWLVDCAGTNAFEFITKPFLHGRGVNKLPRLALTHGDLHHVGATRLAWQEFQVDKTVTSPVRFRSPAYRDLIDTLDATPGQHEILHRGDITNGWTVLHPNPDDKFPQADDATIVLLGEIYHTRILLLSDLGRPGQEALLKRTPDLHADIVVTGLPEKEEPLSNGLLEVIKPKLIIIADSESPATKQASPRLCDRLTESNIPTLYTRATGAITISIRPTGWKAEPMNGPTLQFQRER